MTDALHRADRSAASSRRAVGQFWAGGLATALVAALVALAGRLVAEGLLGVELLPAGETGVLAWSESVSYATGAAALAILATALAHLLVLAVPRPLAFFEWVMGLVGLVLVAAPFAADAPVADRVATAVVAAVVVVAVASLISGLLVMLRRHRPLPATERVAPAGQGPAR